MALSVHPYALGSGMVQPSTGRVRSHDAAMPCRASLAAWKPRRRSPKMAKVAVFGVYFEHLYTGVNGVGKRHQHPLLVVGRKLRAHAGRGSDSSPAMHSADLASISGRFLGRHHGSHDRPTDYVIDEWLRLLHFSPSVRPSRRVPTIHSGISPMAPAGITRGFRAFRYLTTITPGAAVGKSHTTGAIILPVAVGATVPPAVRPTFPTPNFQRAGGDTPPNISMRHIRPTLAVSSAIRS
jgi:hypothetical protein